jgi:hypothetical protein
MDTARTPITREVHSGLVCPNCGAGIENREMGLYPLQRQPIRWVLAGRRCLGGCIWIGDEFRAPLESPSAQPEMLPTPREPS